MARSHGDDPAGAALLEVEHMAAGSPLVEELGALRKVVSHASLWL